MPSPFQPVPMVPAPFTALFLALEADGPYYNRWRETGTLDTLDEREEAARTLAAALQEATRAERSVVRKMVRVLSGAAPARGPYRPPLSLARALAAALLGCDERTVRRNGTGVETRPDGVFILDKGARLAQEKEFLARAALFRTGPGTT
jgi:hypothetical protein